MARIPYVDPEKAPEAVRETLARLPAKLNVFKMMAHSETNFRPLIRLGTAVLVEQELSGKLRELAILRVAQLSAAKYEWVQHVPIGKMAGISDEQVAALEAGDARAGCFDERERLVLELASELVRQARASDDLFERLRAAFPPREIVELVLAIGYYMMIARLLETTGVDLEPPGKGLLDEAQRRLGRKTTS